MDKNKFLPPVHDKGKYGWYPVCNAEEWEQLPAVFKSMTWYPIEVYEPEFKTKNKTVPEYIVFDIVYLEPYKIRAEVKVHVQEIQKILMCYFPNTQCQLYSVTAVIFANGVKWPAKWRIDTNTGAYAIYACGRLVGQQGGYSYHIPENIEETEDGFKWKGFVNNAKTRTHYQLLNPFE